MLLRILELYFDHKFEYLLLWTDFSNCLGSYNKASILNCKMAMSLLLLLLIINMKTIAIITIVGIALLMKLELCWSQFQLQGPTFHPLHHTFFHQPKWKLQDPPQTPLHFNFQYLIVIIPYLKYNFFYLYLLFEKVLNHIVHAKFYLILWIWTFFLNSF